MNFNGVSDTVVLNQSVSFIADIGDLTNFVNVSLSTSVGEGDLGSDRLSALSIVGEGYRSLIYDLKSDAGFVALLEHCATLGQAIGSNPSLPLLLVGVNVQPNSNDLLIMCISL